VEDHRIRLSRLWGTVDIDLTRSQDYLDYLQSLIFPRLQHTQSAVTVHPIDRQTALKLAMCALHKLHTVHQLRLVTSTTNPEDINLLTDRHVLHHSPIVKTLVLESRSSTKGHRTPALFHFSRLIVTFPAIEELSVTRISKLKSSWGTIILDSYTFLKYSMSRSSRFYDTFPN
jgi:hypothetical protein